MLHDETAMDVAHFLAGTPVLLAVRRFGACAHRPAEAMWLELHAASQDQQSQGWMSLECVSRRDAGADDARRRVAELWRRAGIVDIRRGEAIVQVVGPDDDLADCRMRLIDHATEPERAADEQPRIGMQERLIRFHALWGDRATGAMCLACGKHGVDAFIEANLTWRALEDARDADRGHGWVSGEKLVTEQPFRLDVLPRVLRTWWSAGYVEARRGDAIGCAVDDGADVTLYDFRLLPSPYPEWDGDRPAEGLPGR